MIGLWAVDNSEIEFLFFACGAVSAFFIWLLFIQDLELSVLSVYTFPSQIKISFDNVCGDTNVPPIKKIKLKYE